ncbi:MAG: amino acid permease [Mycoplasma sp.]|nr:amino acid permease [Mycoplasma sp.]
MEQKTVRKIGFISALSICFTSIVGIGIFLKNASVGANVGGNGYSWLATWIISGLLAILLAFHFGKISRIESKSGLTGLNSWVHEIVDKKNTWFKKITTVNYGYFYNPILAICLSFFTAEFFIQIFESAGVNVKLDLWVYVLITICFLSFFILNNYFSIRFSGYISIATTIIKTIPLLMVIVIGVSFWNQHNNGGSNGFDQSISYDKALRGIMLSIPSVLFAFDSFIGIGSWSKNIKGGPKAVSKVIVAALVGVTIIYCLISISSIFHYQTNNGGTSVLNVLLDSLPKNVQKGFTIFISVIIFISAFGTSNSACGTTLNEYKNIILHENTIMSSGIKVKFGSKKAALVLCFILLSFWSLILFIPAIIMNNDGIIDGFSNLIVVGIFLVYSYLIFLFWKNIYRKNLMTDLNKSWFFTFLVFMTLIGIGLVSFLNLYFVIENTITNWKGNSNWGLFLDSGVKMNNLAVLIFYACFFGAFFAFPFINYKFVKKAI